MDLASIDHVLTTTRSVRKRLDLTRTVEDEVLQQCIDIALQAPNGGNRGRYHFIVVTDPGKRAGLADIYRKASVPHLERMRSVYRAMSLSLLKFVGQASLVDDAMLPS